jgi:hypothetical protein
MQMECAMSNVFAGVSAEGNSPVSEHLRLTGGARLLDRDPSEYMADLAIKAAQERGELVTSRLIVEAQMEGLLRPGTPFFEAAYGFDPDTTRAIAADLLRWTNRDALIGPDLEPDRTGEDPDGDFQPGDRVRLVLNATSEGQRYLIGTTGLIVRAPTARTRATLAADGHHAFRADDGGAIIVVNDYAIERYDEAPAPAPAPEAAPQPAPEHPLRPDERVRLAMDFKIDGRPYRKGMTGVTVEELLGTTDRLAAEGKYAVIMDMPIGGMIVVPSFALERNL